MKSSKNIRIIDIARMAEVSVGTVDRILHNRGKVSADKREKVERVLKEIDYEPNYLASLLAKKQDCNLAVIIPSFSDGDYWQLVNFGIEKAKDELKKFNLKVDYIHFDQYDHHSFLKRLCDVDWNFYDGVIIATLFGDYVVQLSKQLDCDNIPYIYIDSNIKDQNNIGYFGVDSFSSGTIAANLMIDRIGHDSDVIIAYTRTVEDKRVSTQIAERESGFKDYLTKNKFGGKFHYVDLAPEKELQNLKSIADILGDTNRIIGGITFDSRIYKLANILEKIKGGNETCLIGYDVIRNNIEGLKNDKISYIIAQGAYSQGYESLKAMSDYLLFKQSTDKVTYLPIDILIKENIDYYYKYKL